MSSKADKSLVEVERARESKRATDPMRERSRARTGRQREGKELRGPQEYDEREGIGFRPNTKENSH